MIVPAILETDFEEIRTKILQVENVATLVHIDVADGKFVDSTTCMDISGLDDIETSCAFEIHFMVNDPCKFVEKRVRKVIKVCTQIELNSHHIDMFIQKAKKLAYKVGLSLKEETLVTELKPYLDQIDYVQFVSVIPGKQGRPFDEHVVNKIKELHKTHPHMYIQVDGGLDEKNLLKILKAGAKGAVIGSHIFASADPAEAVQKYKKVEENFYAN
ncbi:MAG TPA: hypothetical protein VLI92_01785 [Candidatus Saccharimonadales bacterium]|nr:hypothetical protein [Candidatus Saccharimonadales bacterium]